MASHCCAASRLSLNAIFFDALRCMADGLPYLGPKILGAIDDAKIDALLAEEITM